MRKTHQRIFADPTKVLIDSEGNQSINIRDLASDPRVRKEVTKLREGFVAEQRYRESLATRNRSHAEAEAEATTSMTEESHETTLQQLEAGEERARNRFRENESS
jgi:hypothetical protein